MCVMCGLYCDFVYRSEKNDLDEMNKWHVYTRTVFIKTVTKHYAASAR